MFAVVFWYNEKQRKEENKKVFPIIKRRKCMRIINRLIEELDYVIANDPAARNRLEVLLLYPSVHAMIIYRIAHYLYVREYFFVARLLSQLARFMTGIEIHPGATIGKFFFIDHGMGVVIGETAIVGEKCVLFHGVTLGGTTTERTKRHPTLGNHVIVGSGAKLLGNIHIGDNCKIGANSVVLQDIPCNSVAVGAPARVVKHITEEDVHI